LEYVNNLRIKEKKLSPEVRKEILDQFSKVQKTSIKKLQNILGGEINLTSVIPGNWYALNVEKQNLPPKVVKYIDWMLSRPEISVRYFKYIKKYLHGVPNWKSYVPQILAIIKHVPTGRVAYSVQVLRNILPYMRKGSNSYEACVEFSQTIKNDRLRKSRYAQTPELSNRTKRYIQDFGRVPLKGVTNPVVKRSLSQLMVLWKHTGLSNEDMAQLKPINVEFAREALQSRNPKVKKS
jgi:hypothetical protein